jgi:hypothetical protein
MPSLAFLLLLVLVVVLALIPTRRLYLGGWRNPGLTVYFLSLIALGLLVAELRGPARYLVPILVIVYVAPFVTARDGIARLRNRFGGPPPPPDAGSGRRRMKNVTPKEAPPEEGR